MPLAGRLRAPRLRAMKSAYELAMERLEKRDGKGAALSAAQKKAIAEITKKDPADVAPYVVVYTVEMSAPGTRGISAFAASLRSASLSSLSRPKRSQPCATAFSRAGEAFESACSIL